MSRSLLMGLVRVRFSRRQHDAENRTLPDAGVKLQPSAMLLNDPGRNGQPQPAALGFRAEKRIEDPLLNLRGNAAAVVLDLNERYGPRFAVVWPGGRFGAQGDDSVAGDAFGCVLDEVDEHLLELLRVRAEMDLRLNLAVQLDGAF